MHIKHIYKKILFLILLAVILTLPITVSAAAVKKCKSDTAVVYPTSIFDLTCNIRLIAVYIIGSIVTIGWVIAGILYLTAAGAPEKVNIAKKAVIACIIGTVLGVLALGFLTILNIIQSSLGLTVST